MTKAKTKAAPKAPPEPYVERRLNESEVSMLESLGFPIPLPDELVATFKEFKRIKDKVRPSNLSDEGWATVIMLYRLRTEG